MSIASSFTLHADDLNDTNMIGQLIGRFCSGDETIYLSGSLGAGKTTLTQAIAKGLGIKETVNSPTFVLMKEYLVASGLTLVHADIYRLLGSGDLITTGLIEQFQQSNMVRIIEWPEKILSLEDYSHLHFNIEDEGESRKITISLHGGKLADQKLYKRLYEHYSLS